ncbi:MAPEG family protein [Pseudomonas sp. HK3]
MLPTQHLALICAVQVLLTLTICVLMLFKRVKLMKEKRIHPQSVALSAQHLDHYKDTRLSDNYNHLFELPILFYVLCAVAIACQHIPNWLIILAWGFVVSRVIHSYIQCTYNKVTHRFSVFVIGIILMAIMWISYTLSYIQL